MLPENTTGGPSIKGLKPRPDRPPLFSAKLRTASNLAPNLSKCSRNDPLTPSNKSPLLVFLDSPSNGSNLCFKIRPNPCPFIPKIRPLFDQSAAIAWSLSILAPDTTSPEPPSAVPSPKSAATCGGRRRPFSLRVHTVSFLILHFGPLISSILILTLSKAPLIYSIIPLRPSRFVLLISPSKLLKDYRFELFQANLKNYT